MNERKKQTKKELLNYFRTILTLVISLFLINQGFSITENFTENEKIEWTLDLALYTFLINGIISLCKIYTIALNCEVSILNKKEKFNGITMRGEVPEKILLELKLEGKPMKLKNKLEVAFPHWLDIQESSLPKPYLTFLENENKFLIDLNYFMDHKQNINLIENLTFDIIRNSEEANEEVVEPHIKMIFFKKLFFRFKCKGITIKLR